MRGVESHGRSHLRRAVWAACAVFGVAALARLAYAQTISADPPISSISTPDSELTDAAFDAWRADFIARAIAQGRNPTIVHAMLDGLVPEPRSVAADKNQAEFVRPPWDYVQRSVSPQRVAQGTALRQAHAPLLEQVRARYGVDPGVIVGIWGVETNFGTVTLRYDAAQALATLAAEGRRRAKFETYLIALIEMVERGYAGPADLKGSWAGALGQPQFMPDVYLSTAVDWNHDGKRDIWNDTGDVFASIANYLAGRGWRAGEPVIDEVRAPAKFDLSLADGTVRSVAEWKSLGLKRADGAAWNQAAETRSAELSLPAGGQGPMLLLYPNFSVIKAYNNSDRYALSVALLARAFAGEGGLLTPWPTWLGALQRDQMMELQTVLSRLGYDAGAADGMFGSNTRRAVRDFQKAQGLPADGYPTDTLLGAARRAGMEADRAAAIPLDRAGVRELQRTLADLGYSPGKPDGKIRPVTRQAIAAFEKQLGLKPEGRANSFVLAQARKQASARG